MNEPVGEPTSLDRPIINEEKYQSAITKIQDHSKSKFNFDMSYEQASGIAGKRKGASNKIDLTMPTLAFKQQQHSQAVDRAGLSGIWDNPFTDENENTTTLDARKIGVDESNAATSQAGVTGNISMDFKAEDFGLLDSQISSYMDEDGNIDMNNPGNRAKYDKAKEDIIEMAADLGYTFSQGEVDALARGQSINRKVNTVSGRGAATSEKTLEFEEWKLGQIQEHDITMENLQQSGSKELYHGWYDGDGNWVMGNGDLALHQITLEDKLKRDGMTDEDARFYAQMEVDRQRLFGHYALMRDEEGNPIDLNEDGRPDVHWIDGQLSTAARELVLRSEIATMDSEMRETLAAMGITSDELIEERRIEWQRDQLEGYERYDANGVRRHVYGSQQWELIGDAQRRQGFDAVIAVGTKDGETIYQSVRFTGTEDHQRILNEEAATLPWNLAERKRRGYMAVKVDNNGNALLDENGDSQWEWVNGTDFTAERMQELAADADMAIEKFRIEFQEDEGHREFLRERIMQDVNLADADKNRIWQSEEQRLQREFDEIMLDTRLSYEDKKWKREVKAAREELFWDGIGSLAGEGATRLYEHFWPSTGQQGDEGFGMNALLSFIGSGATPESLAALVPGLTAATAAQVIERLTPAASIDPNAAKPVTATPPPGEEPPPDGEVVVGEGEDPLLNGDAVDPLLNGEVAPGDVPVAEVELNGQQDAYGANLGEDQAGNTYVQEDNGTWTMVQEADPINTTITLSDGTTGTVVESTDAGGNAASRTFETEDGTTFQETSEGTWQEMQGDGLTPVADTPALHTGEHGAMDWERLRDDLSIKNVFSASVGLYLGWGAGDGDYSQWNRDNPELAGFMELGKLAVTAYSNPVTAGAYVVGRTARGIYDQRSGARTEYWNTIGHTMNPSNTARWMPDVDENGDPVAAGQHRAFFDWGKNEVVYSQPGGGTFSEPMEEFIDRNKMLVYPMGGEEDRAEFLQDLPRDLREEFDFAPTQIYVFEDGGMTFVNDGDDGKSLYIDPERAESIFGPSAGVGAGSTEINVGDGGDTGVHGESNESTLRTSAISTSQLNESEIDAILATIPDSRRRELFLQHLTNRNDWDRTTLGDIFQEDPENLGSYSNHGGWSMLREHGDNGKVGFPDDEEVGS